jgi:hypothetical protein
MPHFGILGGSMKQELLGPKLVQITTNKVKVIKERIKMA